MTKHFCIRMLETEQLSESSWHFFRGSIDFWCAKELGESNRTLKCEATGLAASKPIEWGLAWKSSSYYSNVYFECAIVWLQTLNLNVFTQFDCKLWIRMCSQFMLLWAWQSYQYATSCHDSTVYHEGSSKAIFPIDLPHSQTTLPLLITRGQSSKVILLQFSLHISLIISAYL